MTYLIYTRVSPRGSDWQGDTSCAVQESETRAHLLRADPAARFVPGMSDEFKTGRNNKRTALQALLKEVSDGRATWDTLAVWDIDRLTRSQEGYVDILRVLAAGGKGLVIVRQGFDLASLHGRMVMSILVSISEYFCGMGAEKTKDKMRWMAEKQGRYVVGRTPLGYQLIPADKSAGQPSRLEPDPAASEKVRELFTRYAAGETVTELRRWWAIPQNSMLKMFRCAVYVGQVPFAGKWYPGSHPPIISPELWQAVRDRLPHGRSSPRPETCKYDYLLSGMVRCTCGKSMKPMTAGKKWPYYRCPDVLCPVHGHYIRADKLESAIVEQMATLWRQPGIIEAAANQARIMIMRSSSDTVKELDQVKAQMAPLTDQSANLARNFSAGLLSPAAAKIASRAADDIAARIDALQGQIDALEKKASEEGRDLVSVDGMDQAFIQMAKEVSTGTADRKTLRPIIRAFVHSVQRQADGSWKARYPLATSGTDWHPSALCVEVPLAVG